MLGRYENITYLNPGSTGQPRDGDWRASYGIYHNGEFQLNRIEYPVDKTIGKLRYTILFGLNIVKINELDTLMKLYP